MERALTTRDSAATYALAVAALGLLLGSVSAARGQEVFASAAFLPLNRVMAILAFLAVAAMGRKFPLAPRRCAVLGFAAWGLHAAAVAATFVLHDEMTLVALGIFSTFFEGVSIAALELVVCGYGCRLGVRRGAALFALGYLVSQVYDCVFIDATPLAATIEWIAGSGAAYGFLAAFLRRVPDEWEEPGSQSALPDEGASPSKMAGLWLGIYVVILMLEYGLVQGLTGFGGIGGGAHYGIAAGLVMIVVRLVIACLCVLQIRWSFDQVASWLMVFWMVALGAALWLWGGPLFASVDWMRSAVHYVLQVLSVALAIWFVRRSFVPMTVGLALGLAASHASQASKLVSWAAGLGDLAGDYRVLVLVYTVLMVVSAVFALPVLLASAAEKPAPSAAAHVPAARLADPASPTVERAVDFARRFDAVCALHDVPPGEREALLQAVHGYTIDNTAANLGLSRETVKTSLSRAYTRMGVNGKQAFLALMEEVE